jgi:hypothetical protein
MSEPEQRMRPTEERDAACSDEALAKLVAARLLVTDEENSPSWPGSPWWAVSSASRSLAMRSF